MIRVRGRFAPSPSGRMHLGNLFSALLAWLSLRAQNGTLVLRIEDLDRGRCSPSHAQALMDDLRWLGLDWDEGPFFQSRRDELYHECFSRLEANHLVYPCYCSRAERLSASAPHREDGSAVYCGRCRMLTEQQRLELQLKGRRPAWRVRVPDETISFTDGNLGPYQENLSSDCGDFIIRRSDGCYAYQLAVVADDADMGITQVVRGGDLLGSTPRQIWLHETLGFHPPGYYHVPLLLAADGRRLSKRDRDLDLTALRRTHSPEAITGYLAFLAGLLDRPEPISLSELISVFSWNAVKQNDIIIAKDTISSNKTFP